jgi:glycosyltransferase involved in cell wall biosynthesis
MNVGGTARYLSMLSNGLEANGIESSIATGFVQGAEAEDPSVSFVKLHRINNLGRAINPIADHKAYKKFQALVAKEKPDIIHSHTFKAGLIARFRSKSLIKAAGKEIKFVHTFHGHLLDDPEFKGLKRNIIIFIERALAKHSDKLVTVGKKVAADLLEFEIGHPHQYLNIPPGVNALQKVDQKVSREELNLNNDKIVVGWLARVTGVKNPMLALEVAKEFPTVQFIFGGSGDLFDDLISKAPANCQILGWIDAPSFMSACNVILSTSENEGMPIALIEAQLAGKPVVATDAGSVSEVVINNETGFVTGKKKEELVSALKQLINSPELIKSMGAKAEIHAKKNFSPTTMVQKHLDLYRLLA